MHYFIKLIFKCVYKIFVSVTQRIYGNSAKTQSVWLFKGCHTVIINVAESGS